MDLVLQQQKSDGSKSLHLISHAHVRPTFTSVVCGSSRTLGAEIGVKEVNDELRNVVCMYVEMRRETRKEDI